jgi:transcriptional antiterminator NusG
MAEANWYVVHTYSGYENKVKADIEKTIENRNLQDEILEVRVPMQEVVEMKNGKRKVVQKKMFPSYVLINMIMNDETWYVVRNTRGVTGFVGPGSKPVPLTEAEMKPLGIKTENVSVDFAEGDAIVVVAGACQSNFEALIASGANFASSPKRINIHTYDPAVIAVKVATTDFKKSVSMNNIERLIENGLDAFGGVDTLGKMRGLL